MIRVTVELLRRGSEKDRETLGVAEIANVGGTLTRGDYAVRLLGKGGRAWKHGTVEGFPRLKLGGWDLLFRALGGIVAGRNPKVPFPAPWETPVDGGYTVSMAEADPTADERKRRTIEILAAWSRLPEEARRAVVRDLREGVAASSEEALTIAADVLEEIGRLEPA